MRHHPAARFALLVLAYAAVVVAVTFALHGRGRSDVDHILSTAGTAAAITMIWMVIFSLKSARSEAAVETLLLSGSDDALMRQAATVLRARGIGGVNVDRPARTVRGRRVTVAVDPDPRQPGRCQVTIRAAPLLAWRRTDWDAYRALAASVADEFRTTTAGTP